MYSYREQTTNMNSNDLNCLFMCIRALSKLLHKFCLKKKLCSHEVKKDSFIYMFNISKYVILIKRQEQTWASQCSYCFLLRFPLHSRRWYSLCLLLVGPCEPLRGTCYSPRARLQKNRENLKVSFYSNNMYLRILTNIGILRQMKPFTRPPQIQN